MKHDRLVGALTIGTLDGFSGWCDLIAKGTELENMRDELLRPGGGVAAIDGELVCSCNQVGAGTIRKGHRWRYLRSQRALQQHQSRHRLPDPAVRRWPSC